MRTAAIIAEYNPFHYGHHYQIVKAKQIIGADCLLVLMSGNIVQRGSFACLDKWDRAELALRSGADLVVELPLLASLQSADYFARYSIEILTRLKVDDLVFGTESADLNHLEDHLAWMGENKEALDQALTHYLDEGKSYAAAFQLSVDQLMEEQDQALSFDPSSPNHILGLQYLKYLKEFESDIKVQVIPRLEDPAVLGKTLNLPNELCPQKILTGSQIREVISSDLLDENANNIPIRTLQKLIQSERVTWADYFPLLKYQLSVMSLDQLANIQGMVEGLEYKFLKEIHSAENFATFVKSMISNRWTQASIQRLCMQILLNNDKYQWEESVKDFETSACLRILAFNSNGRQFLRDFKHPGLNLFANLNQRLEGSYQPILKADRVYESNPFRKIPGQILAKHPIHLP